VANDDGTQNNPLHRYEQALETRTSGSLDAPTCRRCGRSVTGRRRNGYCSDKCRMRDNREKHRRERDALLDELAAKVQKLRAM
jgi:hypothetical protein